MTPLNMSNLCQAVFNRRITIHKQCDGSCHFMFDLEYTASNGQTFNGIEIRNLYLVEFQYYQGYIQGYT
jgi:hypothetical protein